MSSPRACMSSGHCGTIERPSQPLDLLPLTCTPPPLGLQSWTSSTHSHRYWNPMTSAGTTWTPGCRSLVTPWARTRRWLVAMQMGLARFRHRWHAPTWPLAAPRLMAPTLAALAPPVFPRLPALPWALVQRPTMSLPVTIAQPNCLHGRPRPGQEAVQLRELAFQPRQTLVWSRLFRQGPGPGPQSARGPAPLRVAAATLHPGPPAVPHSWVWASHW